MSGAALAAELRRIGAGAGLDAVGIGSAQPFDATRRVLEQRRAAGLSATMQFTYRNPARSTDPQAALRGARSLVVGARRYLRGAPPGTPGGPAADPGAGDLDASDLGVGDLGVGDLGGGDADVGGPGHTGAPAGRVGRYAWSDHYADLRAGLDQVAGHLRDAGHRTVTLVDDNALVDRAAAHRAGLGWYGKNTMLLLPGAGSWFVLGTVVTDAVLPLDEPVADGCGSCSRCLPACPTGALVQPGVLDARRCLAWLVQAPGPIPIEFRQAMGDRIYGCDDCQDACPVNRAAARRDPPAPAGPTATVEVDVVALLGATDEEILRRWGRWYIAERDPRYLRRNALVVLGNTADPSDPAAVAAVTAALAHADGLVRAHAVWAAARLGRRDLLALVGGETDRRVLEELSAVPGVAVRPGPVATPAPPGGVLAVEGHDAGPDGSSGSVPD